MYYHWTIFLKIIGLLFALYGSVVHRKFEPNVWIGGRKYTLQIKSGHTAQSIEIKWNHVVQILFNMHFIECNAMACRLLFEC